MSGAAPGWYHAEGDPPNTERYWDGARWTEGPRPIGGSSIVPPGAEPTPHADPTPSADATPSAGSAATSMPEIDTGSSPLGGAAPQVGGAGFGGPSATTPASGLPAASMGTPPQTTGVYPEESKATMALVLSIVGFFCCGLPAAGGIYFARQEQKGIEAGRRDPSKQGLATAALIIGLIVGALWLLIFGAWAIILVASAGS